MIRIMIVEDEMIVRVGIKSMINWNEHGFQVAGEAVDGEEALGKIPELHPHIVLTDIKMPNMDGIELTRIIKEKYRNIKVVVLSCHNDFDFVKQALRYGASDYILKLSMSPKDLIDVMNGLKEEIKVAEEKSNDLALLRARLNTNSDAIKEKFFRKIISFDSSYRNSAELFMEAQNLGINLKQGSHVLLYFKINKSISLNKKNELGPDLLRYSIMNIMQEILDNDYYGDIFPENNESFTVVITMNNDKIRDYTNICGEIEGFSEQICELLRTYLNISVSAGIFDQLILNAKDIGCAWKKAVQACEYRFYFDSSRMIIFSKIAQQKSIFAYWKDSMQKNLYDCLKVGDETGLVGILDELFETLIVCRDVVPEEVKMLVRQFIGIFQQCVREMDVKDPDVNFTNLYYNEKSSEMDSIDNIFCLQNWLISLAEQYMNFYRSNLKGTYTEDIERLKQYVSRNYDKNIPLDTAAGFMNVGKNYFCSIFKDEMGETFFDYLIRIRIDKAKELLRSSSLRSYEIAEKIGYGNYSYFSTLFKKMVGVSPDEFRKL